MATDRDIFREGVFARDNHRCVICGAPGQDAHHIIERRLWPDGGYLLDNGATLCGQHHIEAEQTVLSCETIREAAGIQAVALPPHLYPDERYDKWGNTILPSGLRMRGELFYDESVFKVLAPVLSQFTKYVKYPRTWHLPWSPGTTPDDRVLKSTDHFAGRRVIVTVKMDGENTTFYPDYMHARSLDSRNDATRHWVLNYHSQVAWQIPEGWRVCGENLFSKHSILYRGLPSYFLAFSIWNAANCCLTWDETVEWAALMDMPIVPVLFDGIWDESTVRDLMKPQHEGSEMEGYVVRLADKFNYRDFGKSIAKFVREGHLQTSHNWRREAIVQNELRNDSGPKTANAL